MVWEEGSNSGKGPRQSGKTTLLLHLQERLGGKYVTLEDEEMLRAFEEAPGNSPAGFWERKSCLSTRPSIVRTPVKE
jgi:hypothetical protein